MRRILVACWLSLIFVAPACAEDAGLSQKQLLEKAQDYYLAGKNYISQGNYSAANEEFSKAEMILRGASFAPLDQPASVRPAEPVPAPEATFDDTTAAGTISQYLQDLRMEASNPDFYYNLGVEYLQKQEYVKAEEAFILVLNSRPDDKDACYNLGVLYENYLSDRQKALYYYREYLRLSPKAADGAQVKSWIEQLEAETKADKHE